MFIYASKFNDVYFLRLGLSQNNYDHKYELIKEHAIRDKTLHTAIVAISNEI